MVSGFHCVEIPLSFKEVEMYVTPELISDWYFRCTVTKYKFSNNGKGFKNIWHRVFILISFISL